jgi:hypothetical protein
MPTIVYLNGNKNSTPTDAVDLAWTASASTGVVQYNIYRSLVTGGPYTFVDDVPGNAVAYNDYMVLRATTYFYVVTASNGTIESVHSNEASATTRS